MKISQAVALAIVLCVVTIAPTNASTLLGKCIARSSTTTCSTAYLSPGVYRIIGSDSAHQTSFTATSVNGPAAEHEATVEPFIGSLSCAKVAPIDGIFRLLPGGSHDQGISLEPNQSFCVRIYKGAASIKISVADFKSEVTFASKASAKRSLASDCTVKATRLHCDAITLTSGTYRIVTATEDDIQAGLVFVGGTHRPGPDGILATHVDLSKPAGEAHLFLSDRSCAQISPKMKTHVGLLDQAFHDGGQMSENTVVNTGDTLCVSVLRSITLMAL